MNIVDELKQSFKEGTSLTKLIYINILVFVAIKILIVIGFLFSNSQPLNYFIVSFLAIPADISKLLFRPWTVITYMFLHEEFMHILFNMLWLYWFGKIFLEFLSQKKLITVYLLGGIAGAALYVLAFNVFPVFHSAIDKSVALGASASVVAIVVAISFYVPNYTLNLMFIGPVKLKYIAIFSIVIDLISISKDNPGGHIAHIGGAIFGMLYISQYKKGKDISKGFDRFMDNIMSKFKRKRDAKIHDFPKNDMDYNRQKAQKQEEINRILDKISKSGYDSLTKEEKEILFKMSNKN